MSGNGQILIIVESPTKARTISQFLGDGVRVVASMGHVRDLPAKADQIPASVKSKKWARLGLDLDDNFKPVYVVPPDKKKIVTELKKALKDADTLYLATDEDREGESIGWHLVQVLKPKVPTYRMVFHEITESAITKALESPREINEDLVEAQETRRILDRLVGYVVSPLLWKKVAPKLSAGRVQSVAVRVLVMRERERMAFRSGSYWDLKGEFDKAGSSFDAQMVSKAGRRLATGKDFDENTGQLAEGKDVLLLGEDEAKSLVESLKGHAFTVASVTRKESSRNPYPPFTTSTLQQEANRKLGFGAKMTMQVAQKLYENGYITYMRTDSVNLSEQAITAARTLVESRYGADYLSDKPRTFVTKTKGAQEAHEAIRPAGTEMKTMSELKLVGPEAKLYELIWKRTVSTQMAQARISSTVVRLEVAEPGTGDIVSFRASGKEVVFPGFFRAYVEGADDPGEALDDQSRPLPPIREGEAFDCNKLLPLGHQTKPPARYTEASLVKALEGEGIGRPSTYASIIDTVQRRGYVVNKNKKLVPTFTAMAVTGLLEQTLGPVVNTRFTAGMEKTLDEIAGGQRTDNYLRNFYDDELLSGVSKGEELNPREVCTISFANIEPYEIRVGRYGPYIEVAREGEEKPMTVSLPAEVAPADVDVAMIGDLIEKAIKGDTPLGEHPDSGDDVYVLVGRFGPYVQLGLQGEDKSKKPKRVSLPKGVTPDDVTLEMAVSLLELPKTLGEHPETGKAVKAGIGQYGPYVVHERMYASLKKDDDVLTVGMERALVLLKEKAERGKKSAALRELGEHPDGGPVSVMDGRYGPYVKHKRTNASLPDGITAESVTLEQAMELLAAKAKSPAKKKKATKKKSTAKKKAAKKKPAKKKAAKKKAAVKKVGEEKKKPATKKATAKKKTAAKKSKAKKSSAKKKASKATDSAPEAADEKSSES